MSACPPLSFSRRRLALLSRTLLGLLALVGAGGPASVKGAGLAWRQGAGYRFAPLTVAAGTRAGFREMPPTETGILFSNTLAEAKALTNHVFLNGSGVALGDVDGDGLCDVYLCGLDRPNALYRNLGNWRFEDVTAAAGVACEGVDATGAAFADLDGDGDLDLIVNAVAGGTFCFLNDGHGKFTNLSQASGLVSPKARTSIAIADVNGDGLLDIYLGAYRGRLLMDMPYTYFEFKTVNGRKVIDTVNKRPVTEPEYINRFRVTPKGGIEEDGEGGDLYINRGGMRFETLAFTGGNFLDEQGKPLASRPFDWELGAMFRDINGDGAPDLYVCSDFYSPDRFWINDGHGRFRALPSAAQRKTSFFSMGVDFADINHDGFDDFFVLDMMPRTHAARVGQILERNSASTAAALPEQEPRMQAARNTLLLNRGDGSFAELALLAGVEAADWAWCPMFLDVDLDGFEDLLVTNGNLRDDRNIDWVGLLATMRVDQKLTAEGIFESRKLVPPLRAPNLCFRNRGDLTFEEVGEAWGFHHVGVSHGMAMADLDNDGDLDVVVNNLAEGCGVYRNIGGAPRVAVRLKGRSPNTQGIGAMIVVAGGAVAKQQQEMISGGRYLSSDEPIRTFAAGSETNRLTIDVFWRSGVHSRVEGVQPNSLYEIDEPTTSGPPSLNHRPNLAGPHQPFFRDASDRVPWKHHDEPFDDFARQPLLPWRLSQLGPGVAWTDLDGDGVDDLVVGSGRGGSTGLFHNNGDGSFRAFSTFPSLTPARRDQTTILPAVDAEGRRSLLIANASYEDALASLPSVIRLDLKTGAVTPAAPGMASSAGPMAMADVDGDGDLDLFVGGRVTPGRYPEAATSRLLLSDGNRFSPDKANLGVFANIGLVTDAVFTDWDGDGDPDLIIACEWGTLRAFRNDGGVFTDATQVWGLDRFTGFWNGVAIGDFDDDGRLDIAASNWGRNTPFEASRQERPLKLFYGDLTGGGDVEILESHFVRDRNDYAPLRNVDLIWRALPFVKELFPTARSYGNATVSSLLGERLSGTKALSVQTLESAVFLNRGDHFEMRPLPGEAQWAPGFGIAVGDLDGDGSMDLVMSQNFFGLAGDRTRLDAGRSLWMRGDGHGGFAAVPGAESGIALNGEGRGIALADYDGDGRLDIAFAQNSEPIRLLHNERAKPGVRLRLKGSALNPEAIGSVVRWESEGKLGPAQELHSGGGYWSQSSAVLVLPAFEQDPVIHIRWPGGRKTRTPAPKDARDLEIDSSGALRRIR
ncbi:MAG: VCBS repeat-containing protein [Verrucomicrobia bacterium]|nr:VCBS repeat-containing protein [Verrucomicrobiota bacterium]